jgi:catechol 2,3-dioxygenase-like lactoylglutathione lyase family enzyme
MPTVLAVDHFVLVVSDVERTLAWYQHYAGLAPVRVDEWRREEVFFPSLRVSEETIIDVLPGRDPASSERGHLDHVCFVVDAAGLAELTADPDLDIVDAGPRFGARGMGESIYVRDPDGLLVEFRAYPD